MDLWDGCQTFSRKGLRKKKIESLGTVLANNGKKAMVWTFFPDVYSASFSGDSWVAISLE